MSQKKKYSSPHLSTTRFTDRKDLTNVSTRRNLDATLIASAADAQSLKYKQHQLDMSYNKYLQNLALEKLMKRLWNEYRSLIDQQLFHYEELLQNAIESNESTKHSLLMFNELKHLHDRADILDKSVSKVYELLTDPTLLDKITKNISELKQICNRLEIDFTFVSTEENYNHLKVILTEITNVLDEVIGPNTAEVIQFSENIQKIYDCTRKIQENNETCRNLQEKISRISLQVASLEFSKPTVVQKEQK